MSDLPSPEICQRLIALHAQLGESDGADLLDDLLKLLTENGLSWSDWPELFALHGLSSSQPERLRRWIRGVHELVGRASTPNERRKARNGLIKRLAEEGLDWSKDLPGILAATWRASNSTNTSSAATAPSPPSGDVNLFDVVKRVIEDRVVLSSAQGIVTTLWGLNSYVYNKFIFAPQLGVLAPVSGCGKSTLRKVLKCIVHNPWHSYGATAPAICHVLEDNPCSTILLDEAENQGLTLDDSMLRVLDACYEDDGSRDLVGKDGKPHKYDLYAPVLWALRGSISDVALSLLSRCFFILMKKAKPRIGLRKDYFNDPDFLGVRELCNGWAPNVQLNFEPEIPAELCRDPRVEDNCRPLLAIADSLNRGAEARDALIELCACLPNPDVGLQMLEDAMKVWASEAEHLFTLGAADRISKKALHAGLIEQNPFWESWRGRNDKKLAHLLTTGEMSGLLRPLGIITKTVWPVPRLEDSKSVPGYYLLQFEKAFAEHLSESNTSTHANKIIRLPRH
jgi:hypothetical protein